MPALLHIQVTDSDNLFLSDEGVTTSEGISWSSGVRRVEASKAAMPTARKPQFIFTSVSLSVYAANIIDIDELVGKAATLYIGEGVVLSGYTRVISGRVDSARLGRGRDTGVITIRPSISNEEVSIVRASSTQRNLRLGQHGSDIAIGQNLVHDFDAWRDDTRVPKGWILTSNEPLLDTLERLAFESFWDITYARNTIKAVPRYTLFGGIQSPAADTPVVRRAANETEWRILSDPYNEICNRLHIAHGDTIYTYDDTDSQAALGRIHERSIELRFVLDDETERNRWAARYFMHYASESSWLQVELDGEWFTGDEFLWVPNQDDTWYQVRETTVNADRLTTSVLAKNRTAEGSITPLQPTSTRPVPSDEALLHWETLLPHIKVQEGDLASRINLPQAASPFDDVDPSYSITGLPDWLSFNRFVPFLFAGVSRVPARTNENAFTILQLTATEHGPRGTLSIRQDILLEITAAPRITFLEGVQTFTIIEGTRTLRPGGAFLPEATSNNGEDVVYSTTDLPAWLTVDTATRGITVSANAPRGLSNRNLSFTWTATAGTLTRNLTIFVEVLEQPAASASLTFGTGDDTISVAAGTRTLSPATPTLPAATSSIGEDVSYAATGLPSWLEVDTSTRQVTATANAPSDPMFSLLSFTWTASAMGHDSINKTILVNIETEAGAGRTTPTLTWGTGDEAFNAQSGSQTLVPAAPTLPTAVSNVGSSVSHVAMGKPSWIDINIATHVVSANADAPDLSYGLVTFRWTAVDMTNNITASRTIAIDVQPRIQDPAAPTGLVLDADDTSHLILAIDWMQTGEVSGFEIQYQTAETT